MNRSCGQRLSATASPIPAVSNVHATGESSFPEGTCSSVPKNSSAALAKVRSSSSTPRVDDSLAPTSDLDRSFKPGSRASWFVGKGTWPRAGQKSSPVIKIAEEHVLGEGGSRSPTIECIQTEAVTLSPEGQTKPCSRLSSQYAESDASTVARPKSPGTISIALSVTSPQETPQVGPCPALPGTESPPSVAESINNIVTEVSSQGLSTGHYISYTDSLIGWWYGSRTVNPEINDPSPKDANAPTIELPKEPEILLVPQEPTVPPSGLPPEIYKDTSLELAPDLTKDANAELAAERATDSVKSVRGRSWLGFWGGGYEELPSTPRVTTVEEVLDQQISVLETPKPQSVSPCISTPSPDLSQSTASTTMPPTPVPNKSYGWFFWSGGHETQSETANSPENTVNDVAVADALISPKSQKVKIKQIDTLSTMSRKSTQSLPMINGESRPSTPQAPTPKVVPLKSTAPKSTPKNLESSSTSSSAQKVSTSGAQEGSVAKKTLQKILPQNHVLPVFEACYKCPEQPSMLQQLTKMFRHPPLSKDHLYLLKHPLRIKKAVVIGVHGFFPMRLVRTVLGEPTGTSTRFANHAANSVNRWAEKNGINIEVEKIALEGEGKVGDRVEMLWKLLQNWLDHVRSADFVLLAAHSQGVVVGMQLLARLIEQGHVDNARIGFTAMAGINLGPFGHLPTTLLTGSARELFEFQKLDSTVSKNYMQAVKIVLAHNVRILYVGSIDDQLVPLESSTVTNISHPYIYRAVFVDGRVHAPDFLSHLVGFAMKLRNLGVSDHGLIRELSSPLAGSLYGGAGHSRIYDDGAVYDLGVRHALETKDCENVPLKVEPFELPTNGNPYFLPWSLRGMLEETIVRSQLAEECTQLLEQFDNWRPTSKTLKDVKFRLEGIRSKL